MKTAVVILNYNGVNHLATFLPSVVRYTPHADIWVADNGSTDNSLEFLEENFPGVKLLKLHRNLGFAGGYNEALKYIDADIYVLLNSDVEVTPHWLEPLQERLTSDSSLAACQPKVRSYHNRAYFEYAGAAGGYLDKWAYPFCRGRLFDHCEKDEGQYDSYAEVHWATGACLAIKSELFHSHGGFDAFFFAHMEEIDLCWRLRNEGYKITCEPAATVFHLGGGTLNASNPRKTFLNFRNSLIMMHRNLPSGVAFRRIFVRLILDGFSGINFLMKGRWSDCMAIIKAHFAFYAHVGKVQKERMASGKLLWPHSVVFYFFLKQIKEYRKLPHD